MIEANQNSFLRDFVIYVGRIRLFRRQDWIVYTIWVGMMYGLFGVTFGFLWWGHSNGVHYPAYVWNIPIGIFIFSTAIAIDTIGHRTIYKEYLMRGEALVHHITIAAGITSVLALCLGYENPLIMRTPALALIFLSVVYSLVDEGMHWYRYFTSQSDRVEMWSHFFILLGHLIMILEWWNWFSQGYPGVAETLAMMG